MSKVITEVIILLLEEQFFPNNILSNIWQISRKKYHERKIWWNNVY